MTLTEFLEYIPTLKDITPPILAAVFFWVIKKGGAPLAHGVIPILRSSRLKELRKVKLLRVDPFAIKRQIAKESALFCAFMLSAVVSIGLMLTPIAGASQSFSVRLIYLVYYLTPVLVLEISWLLQKYFVEALLEESARIGSNFRRISPPRVQSAFRTKARKERQEEIFAQPDRKSVRKRTGRRMI